VGGAPLSRHPLGDGTDILTPGLLFQDTLVALAKEIFTGIIIYHRLEDDVRWIHTDNRPIPYFEDRRVH
jgi:hypothetical protein